MPRVERPPEKLPGNMPFAIWADQWKQYAKELEEELDKYQPKIGRKRVIWQSGVGEETIWEGDAVENPHTVRMERDRLKGAR